MGYQSGQRGWIFWENTWRASCLRRAEAVTQGGDIGEAIGGNSGVPNGRHGGRGGQTGNFEVLRVIQGIMKLEGGIYRWRNDSMATYFILSASFRPSPLPPLQTATSQRQNPAQQNG